MHPRQFADYDAIPLGHRWGPPSFLQIRLSVGKCVGLRMIGTRKEKKIEYEKNPSLVAFPHTFDAVIP